MPHHRNSLIIEPATPAQRPQTLQLMQLDSEHIERLLEAGKCGEIDMSGLMHARRGDSLVGAAWGQIFPGRVAFCWSAALAKGEPEETAQLLQQAVDTYLDAAGVVVSQAILPPRDLLRALRLTRAGYVHLADLDYLASSRETFPEKSPESSLTFHSQAREDDAQLRALISRTYVDTLDCTRLENARELDDVLTGYRRTGVYRPEWWFTAWEQDRQVGCVLLADHPEHEQCELMYLGVVPESRGRGFGIQLTRHAQWIALGAGRKRIVLAVDEANWPAANLYRQTGFELWDQRSVYVRTAHLQGRAAPSSDARHS